MIVRIVREGGEVLVPFCDQQGPVPREGEILVIRARGKQDWESATRYTVLRREFRYCHASVASSFVAGHRLEATTHEVNVWLFVAP
jgi:hypothetical protein